VGHIPYVSCIGIEIPQPECLEIEEQIEWVPYVGRGTPVDTNLAQKSNVQSTYRALCSLFEIIHSSLYVLYSSGRPLSSRDIVRIYTEYLSWYTSLPIALRLGGNSTPAVIFTQLVQFLPRLDLLVS
jgi:hypothetical protein